MCFLETEKTWEIIPIFEHDLFKYVIATWLVHACIPFYHAIHTVCIHLPVGIHVRCISFNNLMTQERPMCSSLQFAQIYDYSDVKLYLIYSSYYSVIYLILDILIVSNHIDTSNHDLMIFSYKSMIFTQFIMTAFKRLHRSPSTEHFSILAERGNLRRLQRGWWGTGMSSSLESLDPYGVVIKS